jgi:glycosyltransferase involved in cell wall biosynthesis
MKCSICIATYGDDAWEKLALERAAPSTNDQGAHEVLIGHEPNGTIASARNNLAARATGDWLLFLDADDQIAPGFLAAMKRALRQERRTRDVPLLLTPAVSYIRNGKRAASMFHPIGDLRNDNFLVVGTLVEKDLFQKVGGFSDYPHGFEDWSLWAKCWKEGAEVVQVQRAVYIAYWNPNSKHKRGWRDRKWQVSMHEKIRAELFPELSP